MLRLATPALIALLVLLVAVGCGQAPSEEDKTPSAPAAPEVGSISGQVTLVGTENHMGILVYCAGTNQIALTDSEGNFTFTELPFDAYEMGARHEGYSDVALGTVNLTAASSEITLDAIMLNQVPIDVIALPPPERGSVAGRAVYEGESDHSGIQVGLSETPLRTVTDERGNWLIHEVHDGNHELYFYAPNYSPVTMTVTISGGGFTNMPQVVLSRSSPNERQGARQGEGKRIFGTVALVTDEGGLGGDYTDVWVILEGTEHTIAPDDDGRFQIPNLSSRVYRVSARGPNGLESDSTVVDLRENSEREITLFLETDEQTAPSEEGGTITGVIALADGASPAGATVGVAGSNHTAIAEAGGRFTIAGVPAGTVTVIAQARGHDPLSVADVDVTDGDTNDLGTLTLQQERIAPRVIAADPGDGERDVLLEPEVPVFIRFSEPMNTGSVRGAVQITPPGPHRVMMGREHPETDYDLMLILLKGGAGGVDLRDRVEITVGTGATSAAGVPMADDYELNFTMGRAALYRSDPGEGASGHPSDRAIELHFNAVLRMEEIDTAFSFRPTPPTIPQVIPRIDPRTGWTSVDIRALLTPNRAYTLRMNNRLRTESGERVGGRRELRFRTAPQIVPDQFGNPTERDDSILY